MKSKIFAVLVLLAGMGWIHYQMRQFGREPPPEPSPPTLDATLVATLGTLTFTTQLQLGNEVSVNYDQQGVSLSLKPLAHTPEGWRYLIVNGEKSAEDRKREAVLWNREILLEEPGFKLHYRPAASAGKSPDGKQLDPKP